MHGSVSQCVTSTIAPPTSGAANRLSAMLLWAGQLGWGPAQCGERRVASLLHLLLLRGESRGQRVQDVVVVVVGLKPDPRFEIGCCQDSVEKGNGWLVDTEGEAGRY